MMKNKVDSVFVVRFQDEISGLFNPNMLAFRSRVGAENFIDLFERDGQTAEIIEMELSD